MIESFLWWRNYETWIFANYFWVELRAKTNCKWKCLTILLLINLKVNPSSQFKIVMFYWWTNSKYNAMGKKWKRWDWSSSYHASPLNRCISSLTSLLHAVISTSENCWQTRSSRWVEAKLVRIALTVQSLFNW